MPLVTFFTTVPQSKVTVEVLKVTTQFFARLLSKPEESIIVHIVGDQRGLSRGGSMEPSGYGHITTIERFSAEANKKYAPEICQHFQSILGIPTNRISFVLHDVPGSDIVSDGKTKA